MAQKKKGLLQEFTKGIIKENPVLRLVLGCCATLAVTTAASNAIGMGAATTFVLVCSNAVISLLRKVIPDKVRIPAFITIVAGFVTIVQLFIQAFSPALDDALGVFLPLIVVNCIILGRAEMFASKNKVLPSILDGLGMGVAVTVILTLSNVIIAAIRKIVPDKIRIAMFIVVIAGFVTCVDLLIQAFVPALSESLGVFIPLIVVNCIILGRAESFSYKNGVAASFWDGIFQGFGYTVVLMVMCIIREFLGAGTFGGGILNGGDGIQILPEQFPIGMLTLPVGGFLVLCCLIALMQWALSRPKKNKEESK